MLATLTPSEYAEIRPFLATSSGFQSAQYREVEFLLGNKNADMVRVFGYDAQAQAGLIRVLHAPSLYDEFLRYLARRGPGLHHLCYACEDVHAEACRWEHVMSELVERHVFDLVGRPEVSPFGNPIPGLDELDPQGRRESAARAIALAEAADDQVRRVVVRAIAETLQEDASSMTLLHRVGALPGDSGTVLKGLSQHRADDVDHRVVGALSRLRIPLGRVSDDAECGFIRLDDDSGDRAFFNEGGIGGQKIDQALECTRRLVFIEAQLEMHAHHGEVVARMAKHQVEGRSAIGFDELPEHALRVAEDVLGSHKALERSLHAQNGDLGADCGAGAFGVAELFGSSW